MTTATGAPDGPSATGAATGAPAEARPAAALGPEQRRAALAAGAPKVPRRVVAWALLAAVVLTVAGTLGEHLASSAGINPIPATTLPTTTTSDPGGPSAASSLLAFTPVAAVRPPAIELRDQHGAQVALRAGGGRVLLVTFFNANCKDVCGVVGAEVRHALADLGPRAARVEVLTVNTDPRWLTLVPVPPAVTASGLGSLPNWHFLSGPLSDMQAVWRAFGVSISVYEPHTLVVHNDVEYLVDRAGFVVARGSPFSDLSRSGVTSLPASLEAVAGRELASHLAALIGPASRAPAR